MIIVIFAVHSDKSRTFIFGTKRKLLESNVAFQLIGKWKEKKSFFWKKNVELKEQTSK